MLEVGTCVCFNKGYYRSQRVYRSDNDVLLERLVWTAWICWVFSLLWVLDLDNPGYMPQLKKPAS